MQAPPKVRFLDRTTPPHLVTLVLLSGVSALAMNIFLPSLPNMTAWFDTDYRLMQLSVSLYLLVNAVLQIFIGPISDRYGRRPVLLGALVIFLLATLGTLMATTVEMFLLFRMGQAVVVAGIVLSRAVVRDMVDEARSASMIGYVTMGMALVPMVGPMAGGLLDEAFGWQASFLLLLACGVAILGLAFFDLGETARSRPASLRAQFVEYPELLTARRFWGYCAAAGFASGAFFAFLGGAPYVGTQVYGLSPSGLGLYFGAPALGYAIGNFVSGRFSVRMGINRMVLWGCVISLFGLTILTALTLSGLDRAEVFFGFFVFVALGNGMSLPNATAGMLSVRPRLAGTAAGLGGAITIGLGAALSALAGALLIEGRGALPLVLIMWSTAILALISIRYVIARERRLYGFGGQG
ncbi:multidrug effflux MFS transporter [Rhodobaculum claviforme]|uniref:Bcr/CflA family efflux transporter n=1 Tax=Rhodobaculum claviforme TaxID=1549854 RepID=A0A934TMD7_9RHOB|nr:multidrug effflux MFS transporter [Rhodobaculum claviforme]MBK5928209.1 Bcr/CflA family drug resistance efflux transporter [Rhodobaculum claviforme]